MSAFSTVMNDLKLGGCRRRTILRLSCRLLLLATMALWAMCSAHAENAGRAVSLSMDTPMVDLRSRLQVWFDAEGKAPFEAVESAASGFEPVPTRQGDDVNFGYQRGGIWLRFAVQLGKDAPADWLLEVAYPPLDRVGVYVRGADGRVLVQEAGDMLPFWQRAFPHRNLVFPLHLTPGAEHTVFLRVESEGNTTIPVHLWQPAALAEHDRTAYTTLALYYGLLVALLVYNLLIFISVRDPLHLLYVGMAAGMGIGQLSLNGFGSLWLWPGATQWANDALAWGFALCGLSGAMFTRRFLDTARETPLLDRFLLLAAAVFALEVACGMMVPYRIFAISVSLAGLGFSVLAILTGLRCCAKGRPGAAYFLLAWSLLLVGVGIHATRNLGWLPTNGFTTYAMQIASALEMVLFSFAVADRINRLRREKEAAQAQALASGEAMVVALKRSEAELEQRVRERTSELALANQRLRERAAKHRLQASHDALTGLANRMLLDDRLDRSIEHARRCGTKVGLVMIDLDHFKPVNDTYGHAVGDRLLVVTATRLRDAVRTSDTVARYGGDEFVMVIENIHSREDVERAVASVQARLSAPVVDGDLRLSFSASMGISIYPDDARDPSTLLRRADEAMYAAKKTRRAPAAEAQRRSAGMAA